MKNIARISKFLIIFIIIASWLFSGWPRIPFFNLPPEIQKADAAITFIRTAGTVVTGDQPTSITLTAPTGVAATDVVLAVFYFDGGTGVTFTPPAGWTLAVRTNSTTVQGQAVYWALGNVASYAFTLGGAPTIIGFTLAYTGVDNTTPMDVAAVGQANVSGTLITAPSIITVTANAMLVGFFGILSNSTFSLEFGTHRQSGSFAGQNASVSVDAADAVQAATGASGTKTATASVAAVNIGQLIALRPVAASLTFTVNTSSVSFVSTITSGTPVATSTVLTVNTTNSTGYSISVIRASTTPTLFNGSQTVPDTPNNNNWTAPAATSTAGPSAVWISGTTKGLGFRIKNTGTVSNTYSSTWWGTDDTAANALYSGIATSTATAAQSMIAKTTLGAGVNENTTVEYKVDVVSTQKSGTYISSPVTYTATANP